MATGYSGATVSFNCLHSEPPRSELQQSIDAVKWDVEAEKRNIASAKERLRIAKAKLDALKKLKPLGDSNASR